MRDYIPKDEPTKLLWLLNFAAWLSANGGSFGCGRRSRPPGAKRHVVFGAGAHAVHHLGLDGQVPCRLNSGSTNATTRRTVQGRNER